jgi:hypothetical protein
MADNELNDMNDMNYRKEMAVGRSKSKLSQKSTNGVAIQQLRTTSHQNNNAEQQQLPKRTN